MNEITYSPGILSKKVGISRHTLMRHLHETGLIYQCYRTNNNRYWRIPYNVAMEIANPEALALREKEAPRHLPKARPPEPPLERQKTRVEILTQPKDDTNLAQHYGDIGKVLRQAGVTLKHLLQGYQMKGEQDEQQPTNNPATGSDGGEPE